MVDDGGEVFHRGARVAKCQRILPALEQQSIDGGPRFRPFDPDLRLDPPAFARIRCGLEPGEKIVQLGGIHSCGQRGRQDQRAKCRNDTIEKPEHGFHDAAR